MHLAGRVNSLVEEKQALTRTASLLQGLDVERVED